MAKLKTPKNQNWQNDNAWLIDSQIDGIDSGQVTIGAHEYKMHRAVIHLPFTTDKGGIGIDPGRNFGIAFYCHDTISAIWGKLPDIDQKHTDGYHAWQLATHTFNGESYPVAIEGASFGDRYGQVRLAEIRYGFILAAILGHMNFTVVPPASARKKILGSGSIGGSNIWPKLNSNAADAAILALYAARQ